MASHNVGCRAVVIGDSPPDFIDVGAAPVETYNSLFSPLVTNRPPSPQDQHYGGRRGNRDTTKGTGAPARAPGQGLTHSSCWGHRVQKLADIMAFGDLCFKNSEGFFYTLVCFGDVWPSVCKLLQTPRMHHLKVFTLQLKDCTNSMRRKWCNSWHVNIHNAYEPLP